MWRSWFPSSAPWRWPRTSTKSWRLGGSFRLRWMTAKCHDFGRTGNHDFGDLMIEFRYIWIYRASNLIKYNATIHCLLIGSIFPTCAKPGPSGEERSEARWRWAQGRIVFWISKRCWSQKRMCLFWYGTHGYKLPIAIIWLSHTLYIYRTKLAIFIYILYNYRVEQWDSQHWTDHLVFSTGEHDGWVAEQCLFGGGVPGVFCILAVLKLVARFFWHVTGFHLFLVTSSTLMCYDSAEI